MALTTYHFKN